MESNWRVTMTGRGRSGNVMYAEGGGRQAQFYWEMGGGDVVFLISGLPPQSWDSELPWAKGRRREILERVADTIILQEAPNCRAELGDDDTTIVIRYQE